MRTRRKLRLLSILLRPAVRPLVLLATWSGLSLSLLLLVTGIFICGPVDRARRTYSMCGAQIRTLSAAAEQFRLAHGRYPAAIEGIEAFVPFMKESRAVPRDPWGTQFVYLPTEGSAAPRFISWGADRRPGGALFDADLSSNNPFPTVPETPHEMRFRLALWGGWLCCWAVFFASIAAIWRLRLS